MRIRRLALPSFRSYVGVSLDLDAPRVMICGVNGSGKTSCREAIRWALTGRCESTDQKGAGAEFLVPYGTEVVSAAVDVDQVGEIVRKRVNGSHTLTAGSFHGDLTTLQRAVYEQIGAQPFLDAVLDTGHFLHLHHADAKALVLTLLEVRIPVGDRLLTLDDLDAEYKQAFADRRLAKAKLKDFALPAAPEGEMPTLADIDAQLAHLRAQAGTSAAEAAKVVGQRLVLTKQLEALHAKGERVPSTAYPREGLEEAIQALTSTIAAAEAALDASRQRVGARQDAVLEVGDKQRLIAVLTEHKPKRGCVLDPQVPCETSKHKFNHRVKLLKSELEAHGAAAADEVEVPPDLSQQRAELRGLQAAKAAYEAADQANRDRADNIRTLEAQLAALPEPPPGDPHAEQVAIRIRKGELMRDAAAAHWQAVEARRKALEKQKALQAEVARLEALCEVLGPNGARVGALAAVLEPFQAKVNGFTERFGWTLTFSVEPWGVVVNGRPVETYSESEQFRIGIALQLAVAEVSGLSFAVVDRLDMLDLRNRKLVADMIVRAPVGQVLLLATREPDQALPAVDGMKVYRLALRNGRTEVVESTGVAPQEA